MWKLLRQLLGPRICWERDAPWGAGYHWPWKLLLPPSCLSPAGPMRLSSSQPSSMVQAGHSNPRSPNEGGLLISIVLAVLRIWLCWIVEPLIFPVHQQAV